MSRKDDQTPAASSFPGDQLLQDAPMLYDQYRTIHASPDDIWPWLLQLGKGRAGWYTTRKVERLLPKSWRATRAIESAWQTLEVGQRIADYGGAHDYLEVVAMERPHSIVFRSERYGTQFTWAILLRPSGEDTLVHLRFRGNIRSTGFRKKLIITGGGWIDWATTAPMLAGLAERLETHEA